jgi:hypothetical protein
MDGIEFRDLKGCSFIGVGFKQTECGEQALPNRRSIRLKGWDYASPGDYFVTINTQGGRPLFGTVVKGRIALNEAGRITSASTSTPRRRRRRRGR